MQEILAVSKWETPFTHFFSLFIIIIIIFPKTKTYQTKQVSKFFILVS